MEYPADEILCVYCGNVDPYTLGFLRPRGYDSLRIDICKRCKHYLKVIDWESLKDKIPPGFEDYLTLALDAKAIEEGYTR
jgi:FdhE protein